MIAILTVTLASDAGGKGAGKPRTTADRITGMIQFARLRAVAQRRYHMVRIEPNVISIWAADNTGFSTPAYTNPMIQGMDIPSGVVVWNVENHPLPAAVMASTLGHDGSTAAVPLGAEQLDAAIAGLAPAEACPAYDHPNLAAWREVRASGADAVAVFIA